MNTKNEDISYQRLKVSALTFSLLAAFVLTNSPFARAAADNRIYMHTAEPGDSLIKIGKRFLIEPANWPMLQQLNNLSNPHAIGLGKQIMIPTSAMRSEPAMVKVMSVQGTAQANGGSVTPGATLKEGDKLTTGDNGYVTIKLADGSTLTVQSLSAVRLENMRQLSNTGGVGDAVVRLESGRLETVVAKQRNAASRYEIRTPTSNMGVRGTIFRVGADETGKRAQSEVLEGRVAVTSSTPAPGATELGLNGGYGTIAELGKAPLPPIELLPKPSLASAPVRLASTGVAFSFPPIDKAAKYRSQVARDKSFNEIIASRVTDGPNVNFDGIDIGDYYLSVRAVDNLGLEGMDAVHGFRVKKFPTAPALVSGRQGSGLATRPGNTSVLTSPGVSFAWPATAEAKTYQLQVARDANFSNKVLDERGLDTPALNKLTNLSPGNYFWRVASVDVDGDSSGFSSVSTFSVTIPAVQLLKTQISGSNATFSWGGDASATYQLQLATDENFRNIVAAKDVRGTQVKVGDLARGFYFARVRVAGDVPSAWSERQSIEIY